MVALNLERYYFVFQLFGRSRSFMVGGLLTTGSEAESASVLFPPVISPAGAGGGCTSCSAGAPSHPRDPVLHLPTTPAHSCLHANIPLLGKKQRSNNVVILENILGQFLWLWGVMLKWFRVKNNKPGLCAVPSGWQHYSSTAVSVSITVFIVPHRLYFRHHSD